MNKRLRQGFEDLQQTVESVIKREREKAYQAGYKQGKFDINQEVIDSTEKVTAYAIFKGLWRIFKTDSCSTVIKEMAESWGVDVE